MATISELLGMTTEERAAISDETILDMGYGIQYYDTQNSQEFALMRELNARLKAIKAAAPTPQPRPQSAMVACDCGHSVPATQRMNASMGTSCPDCYDRMSA